jgi:hypothetical protein
MRRLADEELEQAPTIDDSEVSPAAFLFQKPEE